MPKYCAETLSKVRKNSGPYYNLPEGFGAFTLGLIVAALIVLNIIVVYCYRRHSKREMKKEMDS